PVAGVQSRVQHALLEVPGRDADPDRRRAEDGDRPIPRADPERRVKPSETMSQIGISRRGLMLVLSSPSGAGKTSISRRLLELDDGIEMSVSVTTRKKRPGEVSGRDYHFIDRTEFDLMVNRRQLLEHAKVFDN